MGRSYLFECSKCGYRVKVSGRDDRGLDFFVQTISCQNCKELFDAVTRLRMPREPGFGNMINNRGFGRTKSITSWRGSRPPSFHAVANRLIYQGAHHFKWVQFKPQCPTSAFHRVQPWTEPGKCPRCGFFLEKHPIPFRIWD